MKANILVLLPASSGGGAERLVLDQMKHHNNPNIVLHVVTLQQGILEECYQKVNKVRYLCLKAKEKISLFLFLKISKYCKRNNIKLIHTHLIHADMYGFLIKILMPRMKLITTKHNTNRFRKKIFWGLLNKIMSLQENQILAVSNAVKSFISKYEFIPPSKMKVMYPGIDISRFRAKTNLSKLRTQLKIKKDDFIIGIVGRLTKQKGHKCLFQSINLLKQKGLQMQLLVIGTGEMRKELELYAKKLHISNNVIFLGFQNDLANLYTLMDVLCLPSEFEGLGLVILEAMICDTLVIGAKVDGIEELINDGVTGFLVPAKNNVALANVLLKVCNNDYDRDIISRAKKNVSDNFDFTKNIKDINKLYLETI